MADLYGDILRLNERAAGQAARLEDRLVRDIARAYENARRDLQGRFVERVGEMGEMTPDGARRLANDLQLIQAIERRLGQLEQEYGELVRQGLTQASDLAFAQAASEIGILTRAMGITPFQQFGMNTLLELTVGPALDQIPGIVGATRAILLAEMRERLASGDRMQDIARALFGRGTGVFPRGLTSAELATRRAYVQATNMAKLMYYERARQYIPGLMKQAVAAIGDRTTKTCLMIHGQIRPIDKPFEVVGTPSFGGLQMNPPFHWNCRTTVVAYVAEFDSRSGLVTGEMEADAKEELAKR
ncbi:MAG: phage head morphogenesis protein [Anaerolineae bacterium]|nr:phage head morphogenesis protein [Anaerolineae bacterium]